MRILSFCILAGVSLMMGSCLTEPEVFDSQTQLQTEIAAIDNYISKNNLTAIKDASGIRIVINSLGKYMPAQSSYKVNVTYAGRLLSDQSEFDKGTIEGQPTGFIEGWRYALTILPEGTDAMVFIPSAYGYGQRGSGTKVPANATLVFDMKVNKVIPPLSFTNQIAKDKTAIENYLNTKDYTDVVTDTLGHRYRITTEGTGPKPTWFSKIHYKYTVKSLADDTKTLMTGEAKPSSTTDSRVVNNIQALKTGLQKLNEGSKAVFYIPSGLAFGTVDYRDQTGAILVPANSNIILEVELLEVIQ